MAIITQSDIEELLVPQIKRIKEAIRPLCEKLDLTIKPFGHYKNGSEPVSFLVTKEDRWEVDSHLLGFCLVNSAKLDMPSPTKTFLVSVSIRNQDLFSRQATDDKRKQKELADDLHEFLSDGLGALSESVAFDKPTKDKLNRWFRYNPYFIEQPPFPDTMAEAENWADTVVNQLHLIMESLTPAIDKYIDETESEPIGKDRSMRKLLSGYNRFMQAKIQEGMKMEDAAELWKTDEGFNWLVANVPEDIISAFLDWYSTDAKHIERRENLFREVITRKNLEKLSDEEFVEAMFKFAHEGGGVQSGGYRTAGLLRKTIEADVDGFRRFVMEPFKPDCDVEDWLERSKDVKYFGKGIATIYLCWVDKSRYAILNNKTKDALKALGFGIPSDFVERYQTVHRIQNALIKRFPDLEDFKKADYLNHFLVATDEGQELLDYHFGVDAKSGPKTDQPKGFKIAPEEQAAMWPKWRDEGIATIGWDELGDLSGMDWDDFVEVRDTLREKHGWSNRKLNQVWEFAQIPVGSIIVANKGTSEVVGIGKVTRAYYFEDVGEHGHRIKVDWYDNTPRKVDMPGWRKTLIPLDEATLNTILDASTLPAPNPEALFTTTSFDLLAELLAKPKKETYLGKKDEYQKHVIDPFQSLFNAAIAKLPDLISDRVETEKGVFSRILKNDYGRGGAWPHYWGALYPKGGYRVEDPQLFIYMFSHAIRFGFYIGEYGSERRKMFIQRCQSDQADILSLLRPHFKGVNLYFGDREDSDEPEKEDLFGERKLAFTDWLRDPSKPGIHVSVQLSKDEVLVKSRDELVQLAADTWETVFPLFLLASDDTPLKAIREYLGIEAPVIENQPEYPISKVAEETGFDLSEIKRWVSATERKGQAVLYGPPGTGKTFVARKLAKHLIGGGDGFVEFVQFHPAYAYEDFMQGIRPQTNDGALEYFLEPGRFLTFCKEAQNRKDTCVLIIDEINRANLSRVFGELMYLLEYRNESIPLAGGNRLKIPQNVRLIGTMNTADRSIALVDHALRRRFAFIGLYPKYDVLEKFHQRNGYNPKSLIDLLQKINRQINDRQYEIGISFFLVDGLSAHLEDIWRMEIEPYLEEYFFDKPEKVNEFRWEKVKESVRGE